MSTLSCELHSQRRRATAKVSGHRNDKGCTWWVISRRRRPLRAGRRSSLHGLGCCFAGGGRLRLGGEHCGLGCSSGCRGGAEARLAERWSVVACRVGVHYDGQWIVPAHHYGRRAAETTASHERRATSSMPGAPSQAVRQALHNVNRRPVLRHSSTFHTQDCCSSPTRLMLTKQVQPLWLRSSEGTLRSTGRIPMPGAGYR